MRYTVGDVEGSARGTGGSGNGAALKDGRRRRDAASARGSSLADTTAFEALYSDHRRELYGLCRSILRNDHDAQDALQSAFVRALAALRRDLEVAEARPWLYRIARNEAISILRRRSAAPEGDAAENVAAPPEAEVVRREELRELRGDLARLSERQRTVLLLRAVNGLGHNEIAVRTGSSPAAVKHSIAEARRALADCRLGREMPCADARALLATGDRRMWRRRRLRAHVRACEACRDELPRRERTRWLAASWTGWAASRRRSASPASGQACGGTTSTCGRSLT